MTGVAPSSTAGTGTPEAALVIAGYGRGRWRKRKGTARVRLANGSIHLAEHCATQLLTSMAWVRIINESGDDYLYQKEFFRTIKLPQSVRKAVLAAA